MSMKQLIEEKWKEVNEKTVIVTKDIQQPVTPEEIEKLQDYEILECGAFMVRREVQVIPVLNTPTIMHSVEQYQVLDPFGMIIWTDQCGGTAEFMNGLLGFIEDEEEIV